MLRKYAVKKNLEQIIVYINMIFQEKKFPAAEKHWECQMGGWEKILPTFKTNPNEALVKKTSLSG